MLVANNPPPYFSRADLEIVRMHLVVVIADHFAGNPLGGNC